VRSEANKFILPDRPVEYRNL